MNSLLIFLLLCTLSGVGYYIGRSQAILLRRKNPGPLKALPEHYGSYVAIWCGLPALMLMFIWGISHGTIADKIVLSALAPETKVFSESELSLLLSDIKNVASGIQTASRSSPLVQKAAAHYVTLQQTSFAAMAVVVLSIAIICLIIGKRQITVSLPARFHVETVILVFLILASLVAILTTAGIIFSLLFEAARFFEKISPLDFFFSLEWSPQTAIREDQVASDGAFGVLPLLAGTLLVSFIAMCVAIPLGLYSAIYLAEYAPAKVRAISKPALEILAGIPTVVYGFFAALTMAPILREWGSSLGLNVASESALAAGVVMGIMIIPFVSSLSDDVITAVPKSLREGSYALGATQSETIIQVILPAALPGIVGSCLLAVSRAIGETMIVVMAAGLAANLTVNPLEAVTTVTVQIVTLLVGDQEFDSAKTLAAFALGLTLFVLTLILNVIALQVVKKYREKYE